MRYHTMSRVYTILLAVICLLCGATVAWAQGANDEAMQRQVAAKFLRAYMLQDYEEMTQYLPAQKQLFGPYPFTKPPTFGAPKVDDGQALIEFTGSVADRRFPAKGGLVMREFDGAWYVRQIYFYDHIPRIFNLPTRSVTKKDRSNEPKTEIVAQRFMRAWERGDSAAMMDDWYNWSARSKDPIKGLSMSSTSINLDTSAWDDPLVSYTTKLTYKFGPLSYSMKVKGGFTLVKEGGAWKVRANTLLFDF